METEIIILFCVVADYLKSRQHKDDVQSKMTSAEIMTIAITAARFFNGNQELALQYFKEHHYVHYVLSKSQFNRKLHSIKLDIWEDLQQLLSTVFKHLNESQEYAIDSFPVAVCHNIRINRCKIYKNKKYHGYIANKKTYFYGLRVHMIATTQCQPIEIIFAPGSISDAKIGPQFDFNLPMGAVTYADSLYTNYEHEENLKHHLGISLFSARKKNSKRPHHPSIEYLIQYSRKKIETTFSCITKLFPKKIHAVTARGFELKLVCFILAYSFSFL